jgi:DNA-binding transcriptional LysR family regulator
MDKISLLLQKSGLSLDRLHNFCRVAEAGGISNAADGDPGKLSLYSRQIRELEEFFGVELRRRQGKAIVITEAGRRLAQLTRRHLAGLADFKDEAKNMPKRIAIAAGNSVLEWVLLPKLATLRDALPNVSMDFYSDRTRIIVAKLVDMTIDLGLVRNDAVTSPLKAKRLFALGYSLFLPRILARGIDTQNLKRRVAQVPIATAAGGQFREMLQQAADKAKWPIRITVSCSSFTQAACAVRGGMCGAVLPNIAAQDWDDGEVAQLPLPFLRGKQRHICVAWNPRLAEVRSLLRPAVQAIVAAASGDSKRTAPGAVAN